MSALLPCPFCGGAPTIGNLEPKEARPDPLWRVCCNNVECLANPLMAERIGRDEIVAIWNTRAPSGVGMGVDAAIEVVIDSLHEVAVNRDPDDFCLPMSTKTDMQRVREAVRSALTDTDVVSHLVERALPDRETLGRMIYDAMYKHKGGDWRANETRDVWYDAAERLTGALGAAEGKNG